jgi:hypothetical protein
MLPYATPPICAQLDLWEERERDTLRTHVRQQLGSPAKAGARIALAIARSRPDCAPRCNSSSAAT